MKEKDFTYEVTLKFTQICTETTKAKAIEQLKNCFHEDYNIWLEDDEIKLIS